MRMEGPEGGYPEHSQAFHLLPNSCTAQECRVYASDLSGNAGILVTENICQLVPYICTSYC